jgi:hypothetical protein
LRNLRLSTESKGLLLALWRSEGTSGAVGTAAHGTTAASDDGSFGAIQLVAWRSDIPTLGSATDWSPSRSIDSLIRESSLHLSVLAWATSSSSTTLLVRMKMFSKSNLHILIAKIHFHLFTQHTFLLIERNTRKCFFQSHHFMVAIPRDSAFFSLLAYIASHILDWVH